MLFESSLSSNFFAWRFTIGAICLSLSKGSTFYDLAYYGDNIEILPDNSLWMTGTAEYHDSDFAEHWRKKCKLRVFKANCKRRE